MLAFHRLQVQRILIRRPAGTRLVTPDAVSREKRNERQKAKKSKKARKSQIARHDRDQAAQSEQPEPAHLALFSNRKQSGRRKIATVLDLRSSFS